MKRSAVWMLLLVCGGRVQATMIGVSGSGNVYHIDEATGLGTFVGSTGIGFPYIINSLARSPAGVYFSATDTSFPFPQSLFTIDPATGAGTIVASLSFGSVSPSIRALAFSPAGELYAIHNQGLLSSPNDLYLINPVTGAGTLAGSTGLCGIQSLTSSPTGLLYAWDFGCSGQTGLGLVTINPLTGAAIDVNPAMGGGSMQSLAFSAAGALYGVNNNFVDGPGINPFYSINTLTGEATTIGNGPYGYTDLRGLECITCPPVQPAAVPEPPAITLLGAGCLALVVARRMRRRH